MHSCPRSGPPLAVLAALFLLAPVTSHASAGAAADDVDARPLRAMQAAIGRGEFPKTTSVLVMRGGRIVYENYFGAGGPRVLNNTRSATKSITALAVGAALADGSIRSLDQSAFGFFGDLRPFLHDDPAKEDITLADLLTMSSALDCDDAVAASPGNEDNMHPQPVWTRWAVDLPTRPGYRRDASGRGPFAYCTAGAMLLGQVVQRATGVRVDRYVERRLLAPLGIRRFEWAKSPAGEIMTGGGLLLSARDLGKIAQLVLDDGEWHGRSLVPASFLRQALAVQRNARPGQDYGYFFWHRQYRTACGQSDAWFMAGNGGNAILTFRDLDAVVVVTRRNYNTRGMHEQTIKLVQDYVLDALPCARPPTISGGAPG
jgi:CubicO group peptidase (beta-lactamase class C family)